MTADSMPLTGDPGDGRGAYPEGWTTADEIAFRELGEEIEVLCGEDVPPNLETRSAGDPEPSNLDLAVLEAIHGLDAMIAERDRLPRRWSR